jgi:hypothetical protein
MGRLRLYRVGHTGRICTGYESGDPPRLIGHRQRISADGAQVLRWRGDRKEICYIGTHGVLHSVPVRTGSHLQVGKGEALFRIPVASRAVLTSAFG